jgi:ADP-ribose pyrophosphatase YjhB (NUDIX family)
MKVSCGAILYTHNPQGRIGVILGLEHSDWLPFKGCNEKGETYEETALREIKEETCGLVNAENIDLAHIFGSKRKKYRIGLIYVPYDVIDQFNNARKKEQREQYIEKRKLGFFDIEHIMNNKYVHNLSKESIRYYLPKICEKVQSSKKMWPVYTHDEPVLCR